MAKAAVGMAFERLSGKMAGASVVQLRSGPSVRNLPRYRRPTAPSQLAVTNRLKAATAVWQTLDGAQAEAWDRYASTIVRHNPINGEAYSPIGYNAFCGLATKVLQVNAAAVVPVTPPDGLFVADPVLVSIAPADSGILFTASAANSAGVVTELLIQKLPNVRRKPKKQYTSAAFVSFAASAKRSSPREIGASLEFTLPVEPGVYACAYRFVKAATGEQTLLQRIGTVVVA